MMYMPSGIRKHKTMEEWFENKIEDGEMTQEEYVKLIKQRKKKMEKLELLIFGVKDIMHK